MFKTVHNLILIEVIKYVKLQRNLINLQQILAIKKYYEMSFFPNTVKDLNSLPKTLLAADRLKAFKAGVVSIKHHLPYWIPFTTTSSLLNLFQKNVFQINSSFIVNF